MLLKIIFILLGLSMFNVENAEPSDHILEVQISGIEKREGEVRIAIYSSKNSFPSEEDILDFRVIPANSKTVRCTFSLKEKGEYAMALIHDKNSNGKLDFNFLGYPLEPYGFSNNPGVRLRAPSFKECSVLVDGRKSIEIRI